VAIELPSVSFANFKHDALKLVAKARHMGPHFAVIGQSGLRKKTKERSGCRTGNIWTTLRLNSARRVLVNYGMEPQVSISLISSGVICLTPCGEVPKLDASVDASNASQSGVHANLYAS
jgi:hypothetical protein